jgi:hypothetical protein
MDLGMDEQGRDDLWGEGYGPEVVERVWQLAQVVAGNDAHLWRKDEVGAWIHRLEYGNRRSQFGWEIADFSGERRGYGVTVLRPMQWENHVDRLVAQRRSVITADGLHNGRRLL